jgi:hypothetical protein
MVSLIATGTPREFNQSIYACARDSENQKLLCKLFVISTSLCPPFGGCRCPHLMIYALDSELFSFILYMITIIWDAHVVRYQIRIITAGKVVARSKIKG